MHVFSGAFGEDGEKLIAPNAYWQVACSNGLPQLAGKLLQHQVAGGMSMLVVDLLEIIEIHRDNCQFEVVLLSSRDLFLEAFFPEPPVEQSCERIDDGQAGKFFGSLALLDVQLHLIGEAFLNVLEVVLVVERITV